MDLIERDDLLAELLGKFSKIASGEEGHCFFIVGEPGIGKTSLVKAFLNRVEKESIHYTGGCDSLITPRPLAPVYDLALQIKEDWTGDIQAIVSRTELFTKFVQELGNKNKPVVLVFEDIHWADEATLDFVKFFARRISRMNCLFILTCRDNEESQQQSLRKVLGDLSPDTFTRIAVMPFSREAVYKLADKKGFDAENVYSISGGIPFYVNEILASYSPGVPDNIKDAILSVYDQQQEGTKKAWEIFSVIPEGLEINRFKKLKTSSGEAIDHCFALNILTVNNNKIVFKHELYRRTIENALSPFKRVELNKKLLDLFLDSFEEAGEIERILHYAKNAQENKLVVKYAPLAARKAALVGAHMEAANLYLAAIEYAEEVSTSELVELYEGYAHECYLTNQLKKAIIYQEKALKIWQQNNHIEQTGNSMRFLSKLWWYEGDHEKAETYGKMAIDLLQSQPASRTKALAFSNMSNLKITSEDSIAAIESGNKAIEMAKEINDEEALCYAQDCTGTAQWQQQPLKETGKILLLQSLDISMKKEYEELAAEIYIHIISFSIQYKNYVQAEQFLSQGLHYCEERGLDTLAKYMLSLKSRMLMEKGDWNQAASISSTILENSEVPAVTKIGSLITLGIIKTRRGELNALPLLQEARSIAFKTKEYQRIIPVMSALLEYEWLTSKKIIDKQELNECIDLVQRVDHITLNSGFAFWLQKAREEEAGLKEWYEPYQLLKMKKISAAADRWDKIGCPFEKAMALSEGNEEEKRNALLILQQLRADAVDEKIKMEMRSSGIKKIPRGLRESTKANLAQLTNRELDVLRLLQDAIQNKEIADTLFISPKTVDHHISSIFFKLDVNSRSKAVAEAIRLGILK